MSANSQNKIPTSHTLWSPYDTIRDVADTLGITSQLNDEVSKNLAMDVEYRIHEIIEQATKFMRHGKRKTLTTQDIDQAMKVLNLEPLYGYDTSKPLQYKEAMIGPGQTLYYVDDDEVDFETLINQPLPQVPRQTTCTAHWLAVEGVQPAIPQNPNPNEAKAMMATQTNDNSNGEDKSNINGNKNDTNKKDLDVKPLVKHVLSKELQLYFNKCTEVLKSETNDEVRTAALESIRNDPGLHQLLPYFIQFVAEEITHNLKHIKLLDTMLQLLYALLTNKSLFVDPYIHAIVPCILTILLGKKIGGTSIPENEEEPNSQTLDHFHLRLFACSLLQSILEKYSSSYNTLKPRITRTLIRAFLSPTTRSSVGTQYGALLGLTCLGPEVIRMVIVGNLKTWSETTLAEFSLKDQEILKSAILDSLKKLEDDGNLIVQKNKTEAIATKTSDDNEEMDNKKGKDCGDNDDDDKSEDNAKDEAEDKDNSKDKDNAEDKEEEGENDKDKDKDTDKATKKRKVEIESKNMTGSEELASQVELSDDEKTKLVDRLGVTISKEIFNLPNALAVYHGIFFGDS